MKPFATSLRLMFLLLPAAGDVLSAQDPLPTSTPSIETPDEDKPLYASPTTVDGAGRIVAPITLNGIGPFHFIVDTGANQSVLSSATAQTLGLVPNGDRTILLSGVTGSMTVGTVPIKALAVGDIVLRNLHLPVLDATLDGVDGILGVEGFADMRLVVDFANDKIEIARSKNQRVPRGYFKLPARIRSDRLLIVDARVDNLPVQAVIDTGAEGTLGTERLRQVLSRKMFGTRIDRSSIEGVTTDVRYGETIFTPTIRLQSVEIDKIRVTYGDFRVFDLWGLRHRPALLVGMDVLGTVEVLIIDYKRKELHIKARDK